MYLNDLVIIDKKTGAKSLNVDLVECDYFKFLAGDQVAIKNFTFMYMTEYWWGEETLANLTDMKYSYEENNDFKEKVE